jgi:hypothetical protein
MKVLDLQCQDQHLFEGWFGSEDDFQRQLGQGLIECPMCGSKQVHKMLSAPRLNLRAQHRTEPHSPSEGPLSESASSYGASGASGDLGGVLIPPFSRPLENPTATPAQRLDAQRIESNTPGDILGDRQKAGLGAGLREGALTLQALKAMQDQWLKASREIMANTEDVGDHFAAEARRIHEGRSAERGIRGLASPEEAVELIEDGIAVMPLLLPEAVKKTLQ